MRGERERVSYQKRQSQTSEETVRECLRVSIGLCLSRVYLVSIHIKHSVTILVRHKVTKQNIELHTAAVRTVLTSSQNPASHIMTVYCTSGHMLTKSVYKHRHGAMRASDQSQYKWLICRCSFVSVGVAVDMAYLTTSCRLFLNTPSSFSEGNPMATMLGLISARWERVDGKVR